MRFEPFIEAPLSEGFPKPTPVGELHVQNYPKYRVARADLTLIEGRAFWTLFNHIKQREIAMTAALMEMVYAPGQRRRDQQILDVLLFVAARTRDNSKSTAKSRWSTFRLHKRSSSVSGMMLRKSA